MEMRFNKEFVTLAETGNYLKTAELLYMAQSTLSRHIQAIEREVGGLLFDRTTRSAQLTPMGEKYYQYARRIVGLETECEMELKKMSESRVAITVGMIPLAAKYGFRAITDLHIKRPDCNVKTVLEDSATLKTMLLEEACDFCLVRERGEEEDDEFVHVPFFRDYMQLIISKTHKLAEKDSIQLTDLRDEVFFLAPEGTENYSDIVKACYDAGFAPNVGKTVTPVETVLDMVEMNMGVTILPRIRTLAINSENLKIVDIIPNVKIRINTVYLKSRMLTKEDEVILECLKEAGER